MIPVSTEEHIGFKNVLKTLYCKNIHILFLPQNDL